MTSRAAASVAGGGEMASPAFGGGNICDKGRGGGWAAACRADSIGAIAGLTANCCGSDAIAIGGKSMADASMSAACCNGGCSGDEGLRAGRSSTDATAFCSGGVSGDEG